ncbi:MAG TPA: hypothetical protein VE077_03425 [Candidatus Methylomirabilis sp.]|nr:hypothetical protein [Candidatus Methylomirabilis sp.]
MRSLARLAAVVSLASLLSGCAPVDSIFPLYKPEDTAFDTRLIGAWQPVVANPDSSDEDARWIFTHSGNDKFYDFKWSVVGKRGAFVAKARLVQLGGSQFIDFEGDDSAVDDADKTESIVAFPVVSTHMLGRVWLEDGTLRIHFLSDDWVKNQAKAGSLALAHVDTEGGPLVTASTDELRKFMQAHADDKDALSENFECTRVK